jgi:hypothetical protein
MIQVNWRSYNMSSIFSLSKSSGSGPAKQIKPGKYDALVHAVIELGEHKTFYQGAETGVKPLVKFLFEIPSEKNEDGSTVIKGVADLKVSSHERSHLMGLLVKLFEADDIEEVFQKVSAAGGSAKAISTLLGKAVSFSVKTFTNQEGVDLSYIDKTSIVALDPRLPQPSAEQEPFVFNIESDEAASVFKSKLSKYTQEKIASAVNANEYPTALQQAIVEAQEEVSNEDKVLG